MSTSPISDFRTDHDMLAQLVHGTWERRPHPEWRFERLKSITDVSTSSRIRRGSLIYVKNPRQNRAKLDVLERRPKRSVLIVSDSAPLPATEMAVLRVPDFREAIDGIAVACREQYRGKVIAVTGSVGKTTVRRMLDHTLSTHHSVHTSSTSHNGFKIIRSQLSTLRDQEFSTFEVARIALPGGEDLIRPDVAVVGALAEAHMEDLGSLEEIARLKAQLLRGVRRSGAGVINRDSPYVSEVLGVAEQLGIRTITYGEHPEADVRLLSYDQSRSVCRARAFGRDLEYSLGIAGRHNAVNSLSVLGVLQALGLEPERHLDALSAFSPVRGRGAQHDLNLDGRMVTVVDESFNANPTSMKAALESFGAAYPKRRKVLVLGDMLELGHLSSELHSTLLRHVLDVSPAQVFLVGPRMRHLHQTLPATLPTVHVDEAADLGSRVSTGLQDGDAILVKASNGTGLRQVVEHLRRESS